MSLEAKYTPVKVPYSAAYITAGISYIFQKINDYNSGNRVELRRYLGSRRARRHIAEQRHSLAKVHEEYGGVVPELASRAHQQNIVPVVDAALRRAGIARRDLTAVAFTRGPGLLGLLLVGTSFAKGLSLGLRIPMVDVNHLHGHVLSHFVRQQPDDKVPEYPFLCLLISGGNSQIILVRNYKRHGRFWAAPLTTPPAKHPTSAPRPWDCPYPGGPHIDRLAAEGNALAFKFAKPHITGLNYSFSGLKTSFLHTLRDAPKTDP